MIQQKVEKMGLMIVALDPQGRPCRWDAPEIRDVCFAHPKPIVFGMRTIGPYIDFGAMTLRFRLSSLLEGEERELEDEIRQEIIVGGRRHSMAERI